MVLLLWIILILFFLCPNNIISLCSFSVHAIQMGEKVTSIFEYAINVLARKDDVSGNR